MEKSQAERPNGVTLIAAYFVAGGIYLLAIGIVKLISPGAISLMAGRYFMYGLETAGPYMALLVGSAWGAVGWGLFRLHNWARWLAMLGMVLGVWALVPQISMASLGAPVLWYGLQIALRVAAGWYLAQSPSVIESFVNDG